MIELQAGYLKEALLSVFQNLIISRIIELGYEREINLQIQMHFSL